MSDAAAASASEGDSNVQQLTAARKKKRRSLEQQIIALDLEITVGGDDMMDDALLGKQQQLLALQIRLAELQLQMAATPEEKATLQIELLALRIQLTQAKVEQQPANAALQEQLAALQQEKSLTLQRITFMEQQQAQQPTAGQKRGAGGAGVVDEPAAKKQHKQSTTDIRRELSAALLKALPSTLPAAAGRVDLNTAIDATQFPTDAQLQPATMLPLQQAAALRALQPKIDFNETLGTKDPPQILLRPHHIQLLKTLRTALERRNFDGIASFTLYGGLMGGGKSTTLLVAKYFCDQAHALVITISARDFTNGARALAAQVKVWLAELPAGAVAQLQHIPYSADPAGGSSLYDLICVATLHVELALFVFEEFIEELQKQKSVPVLLVIDEYNAFRSPGALKVWDDDQKKEVVRTEVDPTENEVASLFKDWNTFRLAHGMVLYGLSSSNFATLEAKDGNLSGTKFIEPLTVQELSALIQFLEPAAALPAREQTVRGQTGGVCREVTRFYIECDGDTHKYDKLARTAYKAKFRQLLTSAGKKEFSEVLRKEFSTRMAGLLLGAEVPWDRISSELRDAGVVVQDGQRARFVCPAQQCAIDDLFGESSHDALQQAVKFLASDPSVSWRGLELALMYVVKTTYRRPLPFYSLQGVADATKDRELHISRMRVLETPSAAGQYPPIVQGDFVVCWRGASVIDMFAWANDGHKYFIQVSESAYSAHSTKLPNLFTTPIKQGAGYDTVYDFYSRCTNAAFQVGQAPTQLQQDEHYVYITSHKLVKAKAGFDPLVCCLQAPQLQHILGATVAAMFT